MYKSAVKSQEDSLFLGENLEQMLQISNEVP